MALIVVACHGMNVSRTGLHTLPGTICRAIAVAADCMRADRTRMLFSASWSEQDPAEESRLKARMLSDRSISDERLILTSTIKHTWGEVHQICDWLRDNPTHRVVVVISDDGHARQMTDMLRHVCGRQGMHTIVPRAVAGDWSPQHPSFWNRSRPRRWVACRIRGFLFFLKKWFGINWIERATHVPIKRR